VGTSGFGQGIGGGLGSGMGGGVSFFGLKGVGQRHLFVVDLSLSMTQKQLDVLKEELIISLEKLSSGISYQIICFAGPVWFLGDNRVSFPPQYKGKYTLETESRKHSWFVHTASKIDFLGDENDLPKKTWIKASPSNIKKSVNTVKKWTREDLVIGTTWIWPLRTALQLEPSPDVIYFMTDGAAENMPGSVEEITNKNTKKIPINTVAMVANKTGQQWLEKMAENSGGAFIQVNE
jgi:hypothetical protein